MNKDKTQKFYDLTGVSTKIYKDGRIGQYFCRCSHCDRTFIGYKRDVNCGKCVEENETKRSIS